MKKYLPFLLASLVLFAIPLASVEAQSGGFVPCDGPTCSACDFVSMVNSIIVWLFGIVFVIFAILMVVAGFGLVTSGGNQSALDAAKSKFQNALIGIIIMMAAWLIVDTLLRAILAGGTGNVLGFGPWSQVQCQVQTVPQPWNGDPQSPDVPAGTPSTPPVAGTVPTSCTGGANGTCVALGIPCSNPNSCTISPDMVARLQAFHQAAAVDGARVTEAMPPTRTHRSACHNNGTCIDYSKPGGMTSAEVIRTINAARNNGLRPVYEVHTQAQKDSLVAAGAPAANIVVLGSWISAPHFSIYGY